MESEDKRLDFLLAKCTTEVDRAQRFVSRLRMDASMPAIAQLSCETLSEVEKRVAVIARRDPKYVATVIKEWMANER